MRCLFGFLCVCALVGTSPLSASAQVGKVATTSKPANGVWLVHAQNRLPPLLMLRASYYYLDVDPPGAQSAVPSEETKQRPVQTTQPTRSRLERWHPEAFVDPSTPTPEPAVKLEVDSTALQVTPTASPTLEELERRSFEDLERLEKKVRARRSPCWSEAEGAERAIFEESTELMRERDWPAGDRFERGELEIELGVDAVDLRGLDERVHHRGHFRASLGARAEMIFPSEDHAAHRALRAVVVERHVGVGQKDSEAVEVLAEIRDRFSEWTLGKRSLL